MPKVLACLLIPLVLFMGGLAGAKDIVMAGSEDTRQSFHGAWLALIYEEAFRRLGYHFIFKGFPATRSSEMSDDGLVDGEIQRVASYGARHPNMVRVEEPHFKVEYAAYGMAPISALSGWDSLRGGTYKVEYRRGVMLCERALTPLIPAARLSTVSTVPGGLRKLTWARTDVFIDADRVIQHYLGMDEFKDAHIVKLGVMENVDFHAYLHKKHGALAASLSQVLRDMKSAGLIEQFRRRAEEEVDARPEWP
ncbi:polar amino acid transport system substrate-binding protein [Oxalobacteraceae bacterium GrIS 1.11]